MTPQYGTVLIEKKPQSGKSAIVMVLNRFVNIQLTRVLVLNLTPRAWDNLSELSSFSDFSPWMAGLPDNQMADWEELAE